MVTVLGASRTVRISNVGDEGSRDQEPRNNDAGDLVLLGGRLCVRCAPNGSSALGARFVEVYCLPLYPQQQECSTRSRSTVLGIGATVWLYDTVAGRWIRDV